MIKLRTIQLMLHSKLLLMLKLLLDVTLIVIIILKICIICVQLNIIFCIILPRLSISLLSVVRKMLVLMHSMCILLLRIEWLIFNLNRIMVG